MCPAEVREECTICLRLNFNWHLSYKQFLHICAVLSVVSPHTWFNTKYEIDMMIDHFTDAQWQHRILSKMFKYISSSIARVGVASGGEASFWFGKV